MAGVSVAGIACALGATAGAAVSVRVRSLQVISRTPSLPHTEACLDPGDGPPNADAEPTLAANPRNRRDLIAAWWIAQTGLKRLMRAAGIGVTHNGGRSWTTTVAQHVDSCTGRPAYSVLGAHDPWVAFAADGSRAYLVVESGRHLLPTLPGGGDSGNPPDTPVFEAGNTNTLWIYRSMDGGRSWSEPVDIVEASLLTGSPDQARLAVDPRDPNRLYLVWHQISPAAFALTMDVFFGAPAYFSSSPDGGQTWSAPRAIYSPAGFVLEDPFLQHPFVLADGTLVDVFDEQNLSNGGGLGALLPASVLAIRSSDHGRSWSAPIHIATHSPIPFPTDPDTGKRALETSASASSAIAPDGTLYVAWADAAGSDGRMRVLISSSRDAGLTWTPPRQVAKTTTAIGEIATAVSSDGTVGVTYYDTRNDRPHDHFWTTDVYIATSRDRGISWDETHLAGPFDLATAPQQSSPIGQLAWLGEYLGLTGVPGGFVAAFPMAKPLAQNGPSDIFAARILLHPRRPSHRHKRRRRHH
jgi:hypothetical protein